MRSESFVLAEDGVEATVLEAMPFYSERHQIVEVQAGNEHWQLTLPENPAYHPGDTLRCLPDASALLFFDTATGQRIG